MISVYHLLLLIAYLNTILYVENGRIFTAILLLSRVVEIFGNHIDF